MYRALMKNMSEKENLQKYMYGLRFFYIDIAISVIIFIFSIIAWTATGGMFWPLWVLVCFVLKSIFISFYIGLIKPSSFDNFYNFFLFMKPDWEERMIKKMQNKNSDNKKTNEKSEKMSNNEDNSSE